MTIVSASPLTVRVSASARLAVAESGRLPEPRNVVLLEDAVPILGLLATIVAPICLLLGWLAYLRFARWLVQHTGDPASLAHAAALARAVRKQADAPPGTDVHPT